jgi:tetratricopeptide (TPR) repeat protein
VWYHRGQSLYHRREYQAALPMLEKAVALNGHFAPARQLLAQTQRQLGNMPASHAEQGHFYFLSKKYHLARMSYEEALELDGRHEEAHKGIRRVERRLQRFECPRPADLYTFISPRYRVT